MTASLPQPSLVEEIATDPASFRAQVAAGRPAILRGAVAHWPAAVAGRQSPAALVACLESLANDIPGEAWFGDPSIEGRFDFTTDYAALNHDRKRATVAQILDLLVRQLDVERPWSVFAGALPLAKHLPAFLAQNPLPDVLDADKPMLASLWLGNRTRTAAHWDLPSNLACVIGGRRRFLLFPPDQVANLYVGPLDTTLAGQASSQVDVEAPDLERHPRYAEALGVAQQADLAPGDALFVPSLWWHAVTSPDPLGAMVNFWWREGERLGETPMMALLHALITTQNIPKVELRAWQALFDFYVFNADERSFEHIPGNKRGIIGDTSVRYLQSIRKRLIRSLQE